jgi:DNA-binding NarL/FixJ family response regulator
MISVLVVDDQPMMRTGLRYILEAEPDLTVAGEAADGGAAVASVRELQPDIVVMDIRMPRLDGIQATRQIVASSARARVLILTTFDIDEHILDALRAGASGFLVKDDAPDALVSAIRTIAAGEAVLAPSVTRRLLDRFARLPGLSNQGGDDLGSLTVREREVLSLIGKGLSNAEIAAALTVSESTVKTHVGHVLEKLDLRDRVHAVILAYESGLVTPAQRPPPNLPTAYNRVESGPSYQPCPSKRVTSRAPA